VAPVLVVITSPATSRAGRIWWAVALVCGVLALALAAWTGLLGGVVDSISLAR
jgi:hypothetical protein